MSSKLICVFMSKDNFPESRIREIAEAMRSKKNNLFIITTPSKESFRHYVHDLHGLPVYNKGDYVCPTELMSSIWGFSAIWIFYSDSDEYYSHLETMTLPTLANQAENTHEQYSRA